jgi:hypothetical protein
MLFWSHFVVILKFGLDWPQRGRLNILVGLGQHNKVWSYMAIGYLVTPKAWAKHELLLNKLASEVDLFTI